MGYLDLAPKPYIPPTHRSKKYNPADNFESLNNEGHKEVTEDFGDSPHADREDPFEVEIRQFE